MSSDLLHIISYLAGFSLPFFGTVFGKLLIQLHIDVFIICQKRGTDLLIKTYSLCRACVCLCVCGCIGALMFVYALRNPP